jgi:hypothetical protein
MTMKSTINVSDTVSNIEYISNNIEILNRYVKNNIKSIQNIVSDYVTESVPSKIVNIIRVQKIQGHIVQERDVNSPSIVRTEPVMEHKHKPHYVYRTVCKVGVRMCTVQVYGNQLESVVLLQHHRKKCKRKTYVLRCEHNGRNVCTYKSGKIRLVSKKDTNVTESDRMSIPVDDQEMRDLQEKMEGKNPANPTGKRARKYGISTKNATRSQQIAYIIYRSRKIRVMNVQSGNWFKEYGE